MRQLGGGVCSGTPDEIASSGDHTQSVASTDPAPPNDRNKPPTEPSSIVAPRPDAPGLGVIVSSGNQLALELACVASDLISNISPNNRRPSTRLYNAERCTVLPSLGNDSRAAPSPREPTKLGPKPLISLRLPRLRTKNSEPPPNEPRISRSRRWREPCRRRRMQGE